MSIATLNMDQITIGEMSSVSLENFNQEGPIIASETYGGHRFM